MTRAVVIAMSAWSLVWSAGGVAAEEIRVEVTRDTWVSAYGEEATGNNGGDARLKTKGTQELILLDFDPQPLRGRAIVSAALMLRPRGTEPQRRVTVSTLASEWVEGTGRGYARQTGSSSFAMAKQDRQAWAWPGSDLTAVFGGEGHTIWRFADASDPDAQGYQRIAVEPSVVAARVAGISHGLVVMDDVGSEWTSDGRSFDWLPFRNRFVHSREQGRRSGPYLLVNLGARDDQPPGAVIGLRQVTERSMPAGEFGVTWTTPTDAGTGTLGFEVALDGRPLPRDGIPMAGDSGRSVRMHVRDLSPPPDRPMTLEVRAIDAAGNVGPPSRLRVSPSVGVDFQLPPNPVQPFTGDASVPRLGELDVSVIDALDKAHPISGKLLPEHGPGYRWSNHLWDAGGRRVRLHAGRGEVVAFQLLLSGVTGTEGVQITSKVPVASVSLHRMALTRTAGDIWPDPLPPQTGRVSIPGPEGVREQRHQGMIVELLVDRDAAPGHHRGTMTLSHAGRMMDIQIDLHLWRFAMPDRLSFVPQMNNYGLSQEVEREYYRLGHRHRVCVNRLGYSWTGRVNDGCGPSVNPGGEWDWSDYDRRWGPLLDGSAFADLPRGAVPVDAFYLPINENWPMELERHYTRSYWAERALDREYRAQLVDAARRFTEHFRQRGWDRTMFEFYLNNKVYHKRERGSWQGSSAPWVFDEPSNTQDFWALRWYGLAFHEGVRAVIGPGMLGGHPHRAGLPVMVFRCDISRPQWQRNTLDGVMNVNVCGGAYRRYRRLVLDRQERSGGVSYVYGSSNRVGEANTQPAAWCVDTWMLGGDGVVPWQTLHRSADARGYEAWNGADDQSLFYPGAPAGVRGPVPSVRLKSYLRGQQDVEYLSMLSRSAGLPRWVVADAAGRALPIRGVFAQRFAEDAGATDYGSLRPEMLWDLRLRAGSALDTLGSVQSLSLVERASLAHDGPTVADVGYVTAP